MKATGLLQQATGLLSDVGDRLHEALALAAKASKPETREDERARLEEAFQRLLAGVQAALEHETLRHETLEVVEALDAEELGRQSIRSPAAAAAAAEDLDHASVALLQTRQTIAAQQHHLEATATDLLQARQRLVTEEPLLRNPSVAEQTAVRVHENIHADALPAIRSQANQLPGVVTSLLAS